MCTSINEVMCHGIPDSRPLQDGDIVNIDVTVFLNVRDPASDPPDHPAVTAARAYTLLLGSVAAFARHIRPSVGQGPLPPCPPASLCLLGSRQAGRAGWTAVS